MKSRRVLLIVWVSILGLAGCGQPGNQKPTTPKATGSTTLEPEVQLVVDLAKAGRAYQDYMDVNRKGPADMKTLREFTGQSGKDISYLDRVEADGYKFLWNADLSKGISMITTVLAESPSKAPKLMLDGSLGNISDELLEKARKVKN